MANQFLSLALFLMLLSFFIVMNAVSSFDETKSQPVMNSLAVAFANKEPEKPKAVSVTPTNMVAVKEGDTLEAMEGLFNAQVSGFQASRNRLGTVMHVRAEVDKFEDALNVPIVESLQNIAIGTDGAFVQTIITLMRSEEQGKPYRIDMMLNTPSDPTQFSEENRDAFQKHLVRVSEFAEILERAGLPKKMISAGLAEGDEGYIDLYIYRYKPFDMVAEIEAQERRKNGGG